MNGMTQTEPHGRGFSRRRFLVNSSATFGALAIGFSGPGGLGLPRAEAGTDTKLNGYVLIDGDGSVTLMYGGSELGQGTMSGLAQIIAEELRVDWADVTIRQADFSGSGISYFTAGSGAVRRQYTNLRRAGAAAREMLITAGAEAMGVDRSLCKAESGRVYGPTDQSRGYGELAFSASLLDVPQNPPLLDSSQFRYIGKSVTRKDIPLKVQGTAIYGIDVRLPGMLYASVLHCPTFGGTLATTPARPSGALAVVPLTAPESRGATVGGSYNALAVVTDGNTWKAMRAARSLRPQWKIPAASVDMDDAVVARQAEEAMASGVGYPAEPARGDVVAALGSGPTIDSTYSLPYVPHVCMEVLNCTVDYRGDSCEIWVPAQSAAWVHGEAMRLTGLPAGAITVHTTFLGGGLGRKIERDYYSQAIQVGLVVKKPVKLTWTREEDTRFDQYRPMALINVQASLGDQGRIAAWKYRHVSPSISRQRGRSMTAADGQATEGSTALPYAIENSLVEWVEHPSKIPVGYWRSVGYALNAFAVESAIDELAVAAGAGDPLKFRIQLAAGNPRVLALLRKADEMSAWRQKLSSGRAWGTAYSEAFGTHVCQVVEVSGTDTSLRVHRVLCVVDCGLAVNPASVEMQMQGGIIHGLNAALWGRQRFVAGKPQIGNFNQYRMLRVREAPEVQVVIVNSGEPLGGIGEPGVPPIAPAVANAYYRLTGVRIRKLPFFG